jgi:uncharacterized peroxidase-related enzyme
MEPMFLPEVEHNPRPGPYADIVATLRRTGSDYPQIWHLFAFRPDATDHLARFTQEVLRGPSPLSPGLRELIAAYTSRGNQCAFCAASHGAVSAELMQNEALVDSVLRDLEHSPLDEKYKALLRFVDRVNHDSGHITLADHVALRAWGWDDEAIYSAITVCALFNFYNRWVHAAGVHVMSGEAHRQGGKRLAEEGYVRATVAHT